MVRQAYTLRADDDDFGQAGTLVREVWNDEIREAFVNTVAGHLLGGVEGDVLERAFQYWKNVDADTGKQIEELVRAGSPRATPPAASPTAPRGRLRPDRRDGHARGELTSPAEVRRNPCVWSPTQDSTIAAVCTIAHQLSGRSNAPGAPDRPHRT